MKKSKQFKILLSIGASNLGGAQTIFLNVLDVLNSDDFNVKVLIPDGPLVATIRERHPQVSVQILPKSTIGKILFVTKQLRSEQFDIVCCHLGNASLWFAISSLFTHSKICSVFHNTVFNKKSSGLIKFLYKRLYRFILWRSHTCVVISDYLNEDFKQKIGLRSEKIRVIPNGISTFPHTEKAVSKPLCLGIVGRCTWEKGHLVLINALSRLKDLGLKCYVIGDGVELPKLISYSKTIQLEGVVEFWGWRSDTQRLIAQYIDVLIVPSIEEAFSLATLEAFSVSKPVIGSKCGGITSLLDHGINGLLFEPGNDTELAAHIRYLSNHPEKIPIMGKKGLEKFKSNYTIEQHKALWLEHIKKALV